MCRNPTFGREWGRHSHFRNGDLGVHQDFQNFGVQCRGQNTSHWSVPYIIGKLSMCRCQKWARMSHLDIYNTSYGKKKGQESNWQFDSQPLKVRNRPDPMRAGGMWHTVGKLLTRATNLLQTSSQLEVWAKSYNPAKWRESKPG
jgi:hypothetical protein